MKKAIVTRTVNITDIMSRSDVPNDVKMQFSIFAVQTRNAERQILKEKDDESARNCQEMAALMQDKVVQQEQRVLKAEAGLTQLSLTSTDAKQMRDARICELEKALECQKSAYKTLEESLAHQKAKNNSLLRKHWESKSRLRILSDRLDEKQVQIISVKQDTRYPLHNGNLVVSTDEQGAYSWLKFSWIVQRSPKLLVINNNIIQTDNWGEFGDGLHIAVQGVRHFIPDLQIDDPRLGQRIALSSARFWNIKNRIQANTNTTTICIVKDKAEIDDIGPEIKTIMAGL